MKKQLAAIIIMTALFCAARPAGAVEIPLERAYQGTKGTTGEASLHVAYADMERVFNEHPMTDRMKQEFDAEVEKRKTSCLDAETTVTSLQKIIISSTTELSQARIDLERARNPYSQATSTNPAQFSGTAASTASVISASAPVISYDPKLIEAKEKNIHALETGIDIMKKEVEAKKAFAGSLLCTNRDDLKKFEQDQTNRVLKDIYQMLDKIAAEEGYTVIFDKSNVLYGKTAEDITDKVIDRLRGR